MKTKDAYNGSRRMGERFLRLWSELAQGVFPFIMEEVGELDYDHRLFVSVCEVVIDPKEFEYAKWCGNGRPKADRVSIFKAYILKMTLNLKGDKELVELLRQQPLSRRMCGWGSAGLVPYRPLFCRSNDTLSYGLVSKKATFFICSLNLSSLLTARIIPFPSIGVCWRGNIPTILFLPPTEERILV